MEAIAGRLKRAWPVWTIALFVAAGFCILRATGALVDEGGHMRQIVLFYGKEWRLLPTIAMVPGYHVVVALVLRLFDAPYLQDARVLTTLLSGGAFAVFYAAARRVHPAEAARVTLEALAVPLIYLYVFLIYTDIFALGAVLAAWTAALNRRYGLAALACAAALCVRQTNVIWAFFIFVWIYAEEEGTMPDRAAVLRHLKRARYFLAVFAGVAVFVAVNGGLSLGMKKYYPSFHLSAGNLFLGLFLSALIFLPQNIASLPRIKELLRRKPVAAAVAAAYPLFLLTFRNDHPLNNPEYVFYMRNVLLATAQSNIVFKTLFFAVAAFGALSLAATPLVRRSFYVLYPAAFLFLWAHWLIEPRYLITPLALWVLFRSPATGRARDLTLIWSILLSVALAVTVAAQVVFP